MLGQEKPRGPSSVDILNCVARKHLASVFSLCQLSKIMREGEDTILKVIKF